MVSLSISYIFGASNGFQNFDGPVDAAWWFQICRNLWKSLGIIIPSDFLMRSCYKTPLEKVEITILVNIKYNRISSIMNIIIIYQHSIVIFQVLKKVPNPQVWV